jgi:hypothetical protein
MDSPYFFTRKVWIEKLIIFFFEKKIRAKNLFDIYEKLSVMNIIRLYQSGFFCLLFFSQKKKDPEETRMILRMMCLHSYEDPRPKTITDFRIGCGT